nr:MAG TPA: hypothetical protein [Caudoviricetes sp.]
MKYDYKRGCYSLFFVDKNYTCVLYYKVCPFTSYRK